ncbi:MAG TPA: hypothetical protein EYP41_21750 [Anaerolineae bacterium]|nr:hypothetical protein [Anaerolineae bacterium]
MTKKKKVQETSEDRRTRKEILQARKHQKQMRQVWIGVGIVVGIIGLIIVFALVNEVFLAPNKPVAVVEDTEISLRDWQERVKFERAQRIILLENQLQAFGGDVGTVQQFGRQAIIDLVEAEGLAQTVLNTMTEDVVIREEAEKRGITVTDAELEEAIGEAFGYFGGEAPTPLPTPTETVEPTPSVTPIPTAVITDIIPTNTPFPTPTLGPTNPPPPTATPVTEEAFQEQFNDLLSQLKGLGVSEDVYREVVRAQLYRQKLADVLFEEQDVAPQVEQVNFFALGFDNETEANAALADIAEKGFLEVWNEIRSAPFDPESETSARAGELLEQTRDDVAASLGSEVADAVFSLPIGETSAVIVRVVDAENTEYYIVQVSGREMRDMTDAELTQGKQQLLANFLDGILTGKVQFTGFAEGRTPTAPRLDPIFTAPPTPTPEAPAVETPAGGG